MSDCHRSSRRHNSRRRRRASLSAGRRPAGHADRRERREQLARLGAARRTGDVAGRIGERDKLLEEVGAVWAAVLVHRAWRTLEQTLCPELYRSRGEGRGTIPRPSPLATLATSVGARSPGPPPWRRHRPARLPARRRTARTRRPCAAGRPATPRRPASPEPGPARSRGLRRPAAGCAAGPATGSRGGRLGSRRRLRGWCRLGDWRRQRRGPRVGDQATGDPPAAVAARVGHLVVGIGVDHQRGAALLEHAAGAARDRDVLQQRVERAGPVRADRHVRHVAGVRALRVLQSVLLAGRVEVAAGRHEVRQVALPGRMDVDAMRTRREPLDGHLEPRGTALVRQRGRSHTRTGRRPELDLASGDRPSGVWANAVAELTSSRAPAARPIAALIRCPPGGVASSPDRPPRVV